MHYEGIVTKDLKPLLPPIHRGRGRPRLGACAATGHVLPGKGTAGCPRIAPLRSSEPLHASSLEEQPRATPCSSSGSSAKWRGLDGSGLVGTEGAGLPRGVHPAVTASPRPVVPTGNYGAARRAIIGARSRRWVLREQNCELRAHGERHREPNGPCDGRRRTARQAAAQLSTVGMTAKHIVCTEVPTSTWATGLFARRQLAQPIRSRTVSEWPIRGQTRSAQFPDITASIALVDTEELGHRSARSAR